jgi:hypothetical protein
MEDEQRRKRHEQQEKQQEDQQDEHHQEQILKELSALLNTLTSIEEVLSDIDRLTSPRGGDSSVFVKQQALMDELRQWKLERDVCTGGNAAETPAP